MSSPRPFTPTTLAERWSCSERHIRTLVSRGDLAAFRVGSLLRISVVAVENYECKMSASSCIEGHFMPIGATTRARDVEPYVPLIVKSLSGC